MILEAECFREISEMYNTVDKNNSGGHFTNDQEKSESAVSEYAEVDQLKMNESQIYTDITLKPESDGSGPAANCTKCCIVKYALAAAILLAGVAFLTMFIILFLKVSSLEIHRVINNESMSSNNSQSCTEQLNAIEKRIDFLNVSNISISYAYSSDLFGVTHGYPSLQSLCAAILEENSSSTCGYCFLRSPSVLR